MGSKRKGGSVVWFILLAGVLLAVAVAGAEDGGEAAVEVDAGRDPQAELQWCKKECEWEAGQDSRKRRECEERCGGQGEEEEHGAGKQECSRECRRYRDEPRLEKECLRQCEQHEGGGSSHHSTADCRTECKHSRDWRQKQRCLMKCHRRQKEEEQEGGDRGCEGKDVDEEEHGSEKQRCRLQCRLYSDEPRREQECLRQCEQLEGGGSSHHSTADCRTECKHSRDWRQKQRCLMECHRRQKEEEQEGGDRGCEGKDVDEEDNSHDKVERCVQKCERYPGKWQKQQCLQRCWQLNGENGADEDNYRGYEELCHKQCHPYQGHWKRQCLEQCKQQHGQEEGTEEDNYNARGERCREQCRHHHDQWKKQQCLRDCEDHHGGGGGGRGREGDERHGWETVAEAILQVA